MRKQGGRKWSSKIILLIALQFAAPSFAADDSGNYAVIGVGTYSCQEYTKAIQTKSTLVMDLANWLSGYMSAKNLLTKNTNNITASMPIDKQLDWIEKYCVLFPKDEFATASQALTIFLFPKRIMDSPTEL